MPAVVGNKFLQEVASVILANVMVASGTKSFVHLIAAPFTPTRDSDPTSWTEATFDGYTPLQITTWGTVHKDGFLQYLAEPSAPLITFTPTGSTTPNTIYGYYIKDPAGNFAIAEVFPTPVVLNGTATVLTFMPGVAATAFQYTTPVMP